MNHDMIMYRPTESPVAAHWTHATELATATLLALPQTTPSAGVTLQICMEEEGQIHSPLYS